MNNVPGAKGIAYIQYDGDITALSKLISEALYLPEFYWDTNEEPPHEIFGACEAMGCELWLNYEHEHKEYNYLLEFHTMTTKGFDPTQQHDLSLWLVALLRIKELRVCTEDQLP